MEYKMKTIKHVFTETGEVRIPNFNEHFLFDKEDTMVGVYHKEQGTLKNNQKLF